MVSQRFVLVCILFTMSWSACVGPDETLEARSSAVDPLPFPTGAVCGLAYRKYGSPIYGSNVCDGVLTFTSPLPACSGSCGCLFDPVPPPTPLGFARVSDGDRGLQSCAGFYHRRFDLPNPVAPGLFRLPKGTACGFKEACNNSSETCMGYDANVSCPPGWAKKVAYDLHAPSGCGFVWCEYSDLVNLCPAGSCMNTLPVGLVCGITDNDKNNGQCLGMPTTQGCPSGFDRFGFFDDGRSAGHGVGWCAKI